MTVLQGFSDPVQLADIPEGPGVCTIEDERGQVLQVAMSKNIRRRIGQLLDSGGATCVHGPKIYDAQLSGTRVLVRWKLTPDYRMEKSRLVEKLDPLWNRQRD